ncbi:MAG: Site-specific recombinase [Candidatus Moranbacteria bacterium GW2011_GWC1_45_18]|nr:MAG: Site-specific recombinase [Candidatus Moranbacteria bacterium GW2011_GWC2_40_12]KKU00606.1 MAG: Site-specific recombinase [Candidatus Moranbacteria bacterium GW2011_GWC1_45_18]
MKGIIYTRVSSEEQVKGTSLEHQEELCRNFCKDRGIEVLAVFREEGASAKTADRAEFLRAIEFCRKNKGKIDAFVVYKVDRFARNTEDHFYVRKMLLDYGATLNSVSEPIGNNPAEKFVETVLAGSAEFDNAVRKQRCVDGMISRLNQGINPWQPPIGYISPQTKKRGEKKNEPDKPHEEIFPIIQKGLKEFSKGLYSQAEMLNLFDKLGLSKIRGKKTRPQFVSKIFCNHLKFYAGILVNPWTKEEIRGIHKPMITKEEYHKIEIILSGRSNRVKHNRLNPNFPLKRTVLCGHCGMPLTGSCSTGNGGKYLYYHCRNRDCAMYGKAINKKKLEEDFVAELKRRTPKEKFLAIFKATILDLWEEKGKDFRMDAQKYERQIAILDGKRKRIFEMREDGSYSQKEFQERKEEIENEIVATKISLSETRIDQFDVEGILSYANNFISDLGRQWLDLSQSHSRFQKMVFPEGISYKRDEGFGTARMGLIYELNKTFGANKSLLVPLRGIEPRLTD